MGLIPQSALNINNKVTHVLILVTGAVPGVARMGLIAAPKAYIQLA
jgi:hypothetical protein